MKYKITQNTTHYSNHHSKAQQSEGCMKQYNSYLTYINGDEKNFKNAYDCSNLIGECIRRHKVQVDAQLLTKTMTLMLKNDQEPNNYNYFNINNFKI